MSDYTVIGDVGETLISVLRENMSDLLDESSIVLFSPGEPPGTTEIRLMLFLYAIRENEHMKNQNVQYRNLDNSVRPPLSLDLYYMLTPYPSNTITDLTERIKDAHWILGRAMRIFYDHSILKGSILKGSLAGSNDELHIVQTTLSIQDVSQIWNTFKDAFYRLSVFYLVTSANIDAVRMTGSRRVTERVLDKYSIKSPHES